MRVQPDITICYQSGIFLKLDVKLVPSPEADDVTVTSAQSLMPCRDR